MEPDRNNCMADEKPKEDAEVINFMSAKFVLEIIKQGQVFFILCVVLYAFWVGVPMAWMETTKFFNETQAKYEKLAEHQEVKLDETANKFTTSIERLITEMKAGNEAIEKLAEAEQAENIRAEAERRARGANP
jgi:hypothetical protein